MAQHTGHQALRNPALATAIVKSIEQGAGIVKTAQSLQTSTRTVHAVIDKVQADPDQLARWNKEQVEGLETVAEATLKQYSQGLKEGRVHPRDLPMHYGIFLTKRAELLDRLSGTSQAQESTDLDSTLDRLKALRPQVNVQVNVNSDPRTQKENTITESVDGSVPEPVRPISESSGSGSETTDPSPSS